MLSREYCGKLSGRRVRHPVASGLAIKERKEKESWIETGDYIVPVRTR